jgi:hypothetical protein
MKTVVDCRPVQGGKVISLYTWTFVLACPLVAKPSLDGLPHTPVDPQMSEGIVYSSRSSCCRFRPANCSLFVGMPNVVVRVANPGRSGWAAHVVRV